MGRRARQLGERLRTPSTKGLGELLRDLQNLEASGQPPEPEAALLTSTVEVARRFRAALEATERVLGGSLELSEARGQGWSRALRRAGIEEVLRDPRGAAQVRGLLATLLPGLKDEFARLASHQGVLDDEEKAATLERAVGAFQGYLAREGQEVAGLDALLSGYHLVLSARLARLAAALEGKE